MNTPFKMKGKSPMMKALIGKQGNLPAELKNKILASPAKLNAGSTLEKTKDKKGSQKVVNPDTKEVVVKGGKAGKSRAQRDYEKSLNKKASEAYMKDRASRTGGTDFNTADPKTKAKYRAKAQSSPAKMYGKKSPAKKNPPVGNQKLTSAEQKRLKNAMEKGKKPSTPAPGPKRKSSIAEQKRLKEAMKKSPAKNYKKGYYGV